MKAPVAAALLVGLGAVALADPPPPSAPTAAAASNFRFKPPAGWKDQSPGDPNFYTIAVDQAHQLVFQAKVLDGGEAATKELLEKYAENARRSVTRRLPDSKFEVQDRHLVMLAGETAARFVFEMTATGSSGHAVTQLQYYLPAGTQHCVLTFTAPSESWSQYLPLFESIAKATTIVKK